MAGFKAFTLKSSGGLMNVLKTECGISMAFDPIHLKGGIPPAIHPFIGLWDTGATGTVITKNVVDKLSLKPTGKVRVYHANGESIVNTYIVNVYFINQVGFSAIRVTEGTLSGMDVLIGMDIISQGDFSISNVNGNTTFSFRVPSVKEIDFVDEANKIDQASHRKVGRNDPCPCGSKKKYKLCHGKK